LREELVVENKVVRIGIVVDALQYFAIVSSVTGMIFRQLLVHQNILRQRQETVRDVFVHGHAAFERALPRILDPMTTGYTSLAIRYAIEWMSLGVYW
jgi:hypothetical protein